MIRHCDQWRRTVTHSDGIDKTLIVLILMHIEGVCNRRKIRDIVIIKGVSQSLPA